jgi:hypothetical protein
VARHPRGNRTGGFARVRETRGGAEMYEKKKKRAETVKDAKTRTTASIEKENIEEAHHENVAQPVVSSPVDSRTSSSSSSSSSSPAFFSPPGAFPW